MANKVFHTSSINFLTHQKKKTSLEGQHLLVSSILIPLLKQLIIIQQQPSSRLY